MGRRVFCGIEGGASMSKLVLVSEIGDVLCSLDGPATNYLLIGYEECVARLVALIEKAKAMAGLDETILDSVGLCLSGSTNASKKFEKSLMTRYPHIAKHYLFASDILAPLHVAVSKGGLVLIVGTGSNALLVNPDGSTARCGGWGHILGDEASAFWISQKAVKTIFDDEDNLVKCQFDTSKVKELILQHFKIADKLEIVEHCYTKFNKTTFAALCAKLAEAASQEKDPLCCHLFYEAGKAIARMIVALCPKVHKDLLLSESGLPIVCVGSLFKSWYLLEKGFVDGIGNHYEKCTLFTLTCPAALGAAYLGAKSAGLDVFVDHSKNTSVLYTFNSARQL